MTKYLKPLWTIALSALILFTTLSVRADDKLAELFSGSRNTYLRVILERPNGVDIRARTMSKEVIEKAESEGKQVRPTRTTAFVVSYWAFMADGTFKTFEQYHYAQGSGYAPLSYADLEKLFSKVPPLAMWKNGEALSVGGIKFSLRSVESDDPGDAGKKGEVEIGWLENGKPVYFYYCLPVKN